MGGGGVPHLRSGWGYPIPDPDGGGYPILLMGVPHPRSGRGGTPHQQNGIPPYTLGMGGTLGYTACSRLDGVPPIQTWDRGSRYTGLDGVPHPDLGQGGYPGYPHPRLDVVPLFRTGWDTPYQQNGIPPVQDWMGSPCPGLDGIPPISRMGYPPSQTGWGTPHQVPPTISKASTCYAAGGVPLAFTQEDFLVLFLSIVKNWCLRTHSPFLLLVSLKI